MALFRCGGEVKKPIVQKVMAVPGTKLIFTPDQLKGYSTIRVDNISGTINGNLQEIDGGAGTNFPVNVDNAIPSFNTSYGVYIRYSGADGTYTITIS